MKINLLKEVTASIDAETNGLWGDAFAISAIVFNKEGQEIARFLGRCKIQGEVNPWVAENVLPKMAEIKVTHSSYQELLKDFCAFMAEYKDSATLTHMGHVVEAKLFQDAHRLGIIGDWDAPYLWVDTCCLFGDSVDSYNAENGIIVEECVGGTHNPEYDALANAKAYFHFIANQ